MSDVSLTKAVRTNLLSLQNTATMMEKTQQRLATGNKVNSALDNPTNFFTASALNSRASDLNSLLDGMANGVKTLETADNGLKAITKTLESMQSTLRQARQDKSFQIASFDVGANSVLNLEGGRLGAPTTIQLTDPNPGARATVSSTAAYTGPTAATYDATDSETDSTASGAGARTIITLNTLASDLAGRTMTVDGTTVTFGAGTASDTLEELVTQLQTQLGEDYKVGWDNTTGNQLVIETLTSTGAASTAPEVTFGTGVPLATNDSITFNYDASRFGTSITVGGQTVNVSSGSRDEFIASLQSQLDANGNGDFTISNDGNDITVTRKTAGVGGGITVSGTSAVAARSQFNVGAVTDASRDNQNFTVAGQTVSLLWDTDAATTNSEMATRIGAALTAAGLNSADYTVTFNSVTGAVDIQANTPGAGTPPAIATGTSPVGTVTLTQGRSNLVTASTTGAAGITTSTLEAAQQDFMVTYGNASTQINVGVGNASDIAASINEQLAASGISATASFDADNKLVIASTTPETKTLAISGGDTSAIFGTDTVSIGQAATAPLNATKAVDKFVELINRDYGTALRASNDNGRLRLENLSTAALVIDADREGTGTPTRSTIGGNNVREGLAGQFNELKDQLNKLADDASFNGINLLRGDQLTITFNETGNSFMQIRAGESRGINSQSLNIEDLIGSDFDSDTNIDTLLSDIKLALNSVRSQASAFGSNLSIVQNRQEFTKNMINTLQTGAANLTLADMNEEAANLLALQTRQALSSSALSMASQADQSVLQLLR